MKRNIFTAASPNTQFDDALLSKYLLLTPWNWYRKKYNREFKSELSNYLGIQHISLIDSWRSGFYVLLKSVGISDGDEVIIPSFTCVVVANAARWSGATPIYLDTNAEDYNGEYEHIYKYISDKTKVILVQHTFGKIVDVDALRHRLEKIKREDILIVEDFAHTISRSIKLKGDVGIFTFGIEKVISSVRGGAITTNNSEIFEKVEKNISELPDFPRTQLIKSLLNPIFWFIAIPLHSVGVGRFTVGALIRTIWRKLGFLGIMVDSLENKAIKPDWFPAKMAPALSKIGLKQLNKLDDFNIHRSKIAKIYHKDLNQFSDQKEFDENRVYLRYPLQHPVLLSPLDPQL